MTTMKTMIIPARDPESISRAVEVLRSGGLVAFPTDTVYGLGAMAFNAAAVEMIYIAKGRKEEKAIPILIGDPEDLEQVAIHVPENAKTLAMHFWPGALTLVVPKNPGLPESVSVSNTVGVRNPDHDLARALLHAAGPMAVTSANRSGEPNPVTAEDVLADLNGRIALILDGGKTPGGIPSTVVNCTGTEPLILRAGPISKVEIWKILGLEL